MLATFAPNRVEERRSDRSCLHMVRVASTQLMRSRAERVDSRVEAEWSNTQPPKLLTQMSLGKDR